MRRCEIHARHVNTPKGGVLKVASGKRCGLVAGPSMRMRELGGLRGSWAPGMAASAKSPPNEPKKVRKDFRRENGSTQGGFLPRKVAFCSLSGKKQKARNKMPAGERLFIRKSALSAIFYCEFGAGKYYLM